MRGCEATGQASERLQSQLKDLKARVEQDQQRMAAFQRDARPADHARDAGQRPAGRDSSTPRPCWRSTSWASSWWRPPATASCARRSTARPQGDPEMVVASDPRLQAEGGSFATALSSRFAPAESELEQEQAQLSHRARPQLSPRSRDSPPDAGSGPAETGRGRQAGRERFAAHGRRPPTASNWCARISIS
jgi:hypothetical protein